MVEASTSRRVAKNTMYLYVRTIVSLLASVFTTRILLDALGESDYGLYNVVGGAIAMLGFLSASLSGATQRYLSYAEGSGDKNKIIEYFNNSIIIHYGLALAMILVFAIASLFFFNGILNIPAGRDGAAIIVYVCMLVSTIFSITVVPYDAEINAHENMLFYSLLGIIDVVVKLLIAVAVLFFDSDKLIFYAILMAAESFALRLISQQYCKRKYEECRSVHLRKHYDKHIVKEMMSFASWNLLGIAAGMISLFGMGIVVNHYFSTEVNAAMGVATQLNGVMMGLSMNMIKAVSPVLVKSEGGGEHQRMIEMSYVSCRYSYIIFAVFALPVLFFLPYVFGVWLKEVPRWTTTFCAILIVATLIEQTNVVLHQSINAGGNVKKYNVLVFIDCILILPIGAVMFHFLSCPPYWIQILWLVFHSFFIGIIRLYIAREKIHLSVRRYLKVVLLPLLFPTIGTLVFGFAVVQLCTSLLISKLIGLFVLCLLSSVLFLTTATTKEEKKKFIPVYNKIQENESHKENPCQP